MCFYADLLLYCHYDLLQHERFLLPLSAGQASGFSCEFIMLEERVLFYLVSGYGYLSTIMIYRGREDSFLFYVALGNGPILSCFFLFMLIFCVSLSLRFTVVGFFYSFIQGMIEQVLSLTMF